MVFVEFTAPKGLYRGKHYFVGRDTHAVLADTRGGKEFGSAKFSSHRTMTRKEAERLKLGYLDKGIRAVEEGTPSFKLGSPH